MTQNPVGWFEIYIQDMPKAKTFYEAVLNVKLEKLDSPELEMWAFPCIKGGSGTTGALVKMQGVPSGGNSTMVYFSCVDCAVEAKRVVENGGKICRDKFSIGQWGHIALVIDPDGNAFGLHSAK